MNNDTKINCKLEKYKNTPICREERRRDIREIVSTLKETGFIGSRNGDRKGKSAFQWLLLIGALIWWIIPDPIPIVDDIAILAFAYWNFKRQT